MTDGGVSASLDRASQALDRIERALARSQQIGDRDEQLRSKVRDAVAELDAMIQEASR